MAAAAATQPTKVYTDEKARRLMRTFGASLAFAGLICWLDIVILRPSMAMEEEMRDMDPSEIIASLFPIKTVTIFVTGPFLALLTYWIVAYGKKTGWKLLSFIKILGLVFVLFGMCGVDIVDTWQHSISASVFLTTLLCCNLTDKKTSKLTEELPFYDHSDLLSTSRLYMTLAFIVPFSILSVLDHGDQKQRWPVPVLMGGTYGFVFGSILGLFLNHFQAKKKEKQ